MGVTIATTRVACNTSTGTQTITTTDLGGLTPKAAKFIVTKCTSDGTAADDAALTIGATDGTNEWSMAITDEHGVTTTDSYNDTNLSSCINIISPADGSVDGTAIFDSWTTNGVVIDWTDAPAAGYLLTVVFYAGTDLSVYVGNASLGNSTDLETNITDPGFEPDIVEGFVTSTQSRAAIGVAHWDGSSTITQRCVCVVRRDGRTTSECYSKAYSDRMVAEKLVNGTEDWQGEAANFDSSGFSVITRSAGGNNTNFKYIALNFGGVVDAAVWTYGTPNGTGDKDDTGAGFEPTYIQYIQTNGAVDVNYGDRRAGSIGLAQITENAQYNDTIASEDGVSTTNTQSLSDNQFSNFPDDNGSARFASTFVEFLSTGVRHNVTTGIDISWFGWGIGTAAAGGDPEGPLVGGKLVGGGILAGRLVR